MAVFSLHRAFLVHRLADDIDDAAEHLGPTDKDRRAVSDLLTAHRPSVESMAMVRTAPRAADFSTRRALIVVPSHSGSPAGHLERTSTTAPITWRTQPTWRRLPDCGLSSSPPEPLPPPCAAALVAKPWRAPWGAARLRRFAAAAGAASVAAFAIPLSFIAQSASAPRFLDQFRGDLRLALTVIGEDSSIISPALRVALSIAVILALICRPVPAAPERPAPRLVRIRSEKNFAALAHIRRPRPLALPRLSGAEGMSCWAVGTADDRLEASKTACNVELPASNMPIILAIPSAWRNQPAWHRAVDALDDLVREVAVQDVVVFLADGDDLDRLALAKPTGGRGPARSGC